MIDIILKFGENGTLVGGIDFNNEKLCLEVPNKADCDLICLKDFKENKSKIYLNNETYKYIKKEYNSNTYIFLKKINLTQNLINASIDLFDQGLQIYDNKGCFLYGNKTSEELWGYKSEDLKNRHILDIYKLDEKYSTVLTVLRTKKPIENRCDRFKSKNGKTLTTLNMGYPIIYEDEVCGVIVFENDLTSIKAYENKKLSIEKYLNLKNTKDNDTLYTFDEIIYESTIIDNVIKTSKKVALTDSSVLIYGETGTGKEIFTQSIHTYGNRKFKPFIAVNCSAIPDNLFESLFFGTEKGAFTGSIPKKGFFEQADGGTLFLDEINSLSIENQAKLLRVLDEKHFQRLGGNNKIKCNVRVISASNEDLKDLVKKGRMREDFYYRIAVVEITIPAIRKRKSDIKVLANYFLKELNEKYGFGPEKFSEEVLSIFKMYDWPGNVREIKHIVEFSFNNANKNDLILNTINLPEFLSDKNIVTIKNFEETMDLKEILNQYEISVLLENLIENNYNITKTASKLGISRQNLQYRIKKYGLIK